MHATMDVQRVTKLDKIRSERILGTSHESGRHRTASPGEDDVVVWVSCDEKRGAPRRKEGDGNESTREKEERKT